MSSSPSASDVVRPTGAPTAGGGRQPVPVHLSVAAAIYVAAIVLAGAVVVGSAIRQLYVLPPKHDLYYLLALTLLSSLLPVKLPNVSANVSVSEAFIFAGTLRFGAPGGVPLVFLDALIICFQMARRRTAWQKMVFSLAAPPVALWAASAVLFRLAHTAPLAWLPIAERPDLWVFFRGMLAFTLVYFLLNTWLVAFAIALERHMSPYQVWRRNFSHLWLNYTAGSSIAFLLVYNSPAEIGSASLFFVFPLLFVLFLTYRWMTERVQQAEQHVAEMTRTFMQTIEALAMAIDAKDQVTHGHIRRVQRNTTELARALGVTDEKTLDAIRAAALLHDTGKLAVPEYILNKPGPLTKAEFERMKLHATIGADILKSIDFPYPVEPIVRHHHEHWDGTGYPTGLKGTSIPLGARILAVVDCYDALMSDRPYRSRMTRAETEAYLRSMAHTRYDPWVVEGFIKILDRLEALDTAEGAARAAAPAPGLTRAQLQVITATRAEDREFRKLKRELPAVSTAQKAADTLLERLEAITPATTIVIYVPLPEATDLYAAGGAGLGASAFLGTHVPIGERVSGWVFANRQPMLNSEAALELGPIARATAVPLAWALVVPVMDGGRCSGVVALFGAEKFTADHQRLVESAVGLLPAGIVAAAS